MTTKNITWQYVDEATYIACCYGPDGDEPGDVVVRLERTDEYPDPDASGETVTRWRLYEPESGDSSEEYESEEEAREALASWCADRDETPDVATVTAEIEATGYFDRPGIIPLVLSEMTGHSQGYLLITPDVSHPVGTRWTTDGYLQRPHLRVSATHDNRAVAADELLRAIRDCLAQ